MVVRRCFLFLLLVGVFGYSVAHHNYRQSSRLLMRTPREHVADILLHRQFVQYNIVARDFLPPSPSWSVSLNAVLQQKDSSNYYAFFPKGMQKYVVSGQIEHMNSDKKYFGDFDASYAFFGNIRTAKNHNADFFYPYLVIDTTYSTGRAASGHLSFGHIWRTRQWTFGLAATGLAGRMNAAGNIRHLSKWSEVRVREGVYVWVDDYWLGQWASFSYYWQQLKISSSIGARTLYRHLGFGLWNWDRTIAAESMSFNNNTGQVAAGLQVTARENGFVAAIHGAHRWMSHADKAYWAVASSERQHLQIHLGYRRDFGESTAEWLADVRLHRRTGVEHFYDSVGLRGHRRYERLFSSPMYSNSARLAGMSLALELPLAQGVVWGRLWGGYGGYRSKYENPENTYSNAYFRSEADVGYLRYNYENWRSFQLHAVWQSAARAEPNFSRHIKEPLKSSFLIPTLQYLEAAVFDVSLQVEWGYKLFNRFTLVGIPHVGFHTAINLTKAFYGGLELRIQKD